MKSVRSVGYPILALGLFALWAPAAASAATHTVNPGDSIQAAIDAASPGDTIKVMPGDYVGVPAGSAAAAIRITKSLKLIAKSKPHKGVRVRILPDAGGLLRHGILVEPANPGDPVVNKVMIKGFTVEGFPKHGIWLRYVNNFKILKNESINNLENGIFPTLSANGSVKKNIAYGSEDAALWVEASENVRVLKNELSFSPTGLEVTISKNITVMKNDVHDNTIGIGLYHPAAAGLPPLQPLTDNGYWKVSKNHVYNNNNPNSASPGSMSGALPPGGGILVLGVDHVDVTNNLVENNSYFGIAVIDFCFAVDGTSLDCVTNPPEVSDTAPDYIRIIGNTLVNNGTTFPPGFPPINRDIVSIPLAGPNNCFSDNTFMTSLFVPSPVEC